jgi:hypothetical protein
VRKRKKGCCLHSGSHEPVPNKSCLLGDPVRIFCLFVCVPYDSVNTIGTTDNKGGHNSVRNTVFFFASFPEKEHGISEHTSKAFEDKVLKRMSSPQNEDGRRKWRKLL